MWKLQGDLLWGKVKAKATWLPRGTRTWFRGENAKEATQDFQSACLLCYHYKCVLKRKQWHGAKSQGTKAGPGSPYSFPERASELLTWLDPACTRRPQRCLSQIRRHSPGLPLPTVFRDGVLAEIWAALQCPAALSVRKQPWERVRSETQHLRAAVSSFMLWRQTSSPDATLTSSATSDRLLSFLCFR